MRIFHKWHSHNINIIIVVIDIFVALLCFLNAILWMCPLIFFPLKFSFGEQDYVKAFSKNSPMKMYPD